MPCDQGTELRRGGVTDGVGDVDRGGTRSNRRLNHLVEELRIAAASVFTGELNVFNERAGIAHHLGNDAEHIGTALAQLVLEVDVAGGDEGVNAPMRCWRHGIGTGLDVGPRSTGQAADDRAVVATHLLGDPLYGGEVTRTGERESRLDHIHTKSRANCWAMASFSSRLRLAPGDCSPSRRVVSKIRTRPGSLAMEEAPAEVLVGMTMS